MILTTAQRQGRWLFGLFGCIGLTYGTIFLTVSWYQALPSETQVALSHLGMFMLWYLGAILILGMPGLLLNAIAHVLKVEKLKPWAVGFFALGAFVAFSSGLDLLKVVR